MFDLKIDHTYLSMLASKPLRLEQFVHNLFVRHGSVLALIAEANDQKWFVTSNLFQAFVEDCQILVANEVADVLLMSSSVSFEAVVVSGISTNHCTIKKDNLSAFAKFWVVCPEPVLSHCCALSMVGKEAFVGFPVFAQLFCEPFDKIMRLSAGEV